MPTAHIESLDYEAQGVARVDGKTVFVEGALSGEVVEYASYRRKPTFERAVATEIRQSSPQRVVPRCPSFGVCGGCSMQHLDFSAQVAAKQRVLEDNLWHIGRLRPDQVFAPIYGQAWGYRHRARLGVRLVPKKGGVLVGFHERRSSYICDMQSCEVLPASVSKLLVPLRAVVGSLSIARRVPQIEVSIGGAQIVLVFRILEPLEAADHLILRDFAQSAGVNVMLQPKGPDSVVPLWPVEPDPLSYELPEFGISIGFLPTDFTQVNHEINAVLVRRALALLQPMAGERVADMFCGLGNFSLPIARSGAYVVGVEGSDGLVDRARQNAARNGLASQTEFHAANLFAVDPESLERWGGFDKMLIDPPREGAAELVRALPGEKGPERIVYVSCNPATLARDAAVLVTEKGYRLAGAGVVNMFPQTSHVESIALFLKSGGD
ncbi:MAG TPA: 23S rRNA (uracil(1939)-C(5))-methyltransferase RlmD [Rhodocyclaceae bacterium]